ncbi:class I SAM-dependent methyltransferase [Sphingobacterium tabacisoli]|uniref:Class I SAM-dependent methyltransferase n=1 Tax=Sphingobacterium tabacisoli TaxID=2044855 RepID=A0ABW5L9Q1_9SPHI|nr:class I SAM-dependent methyltransferase [Sphingobacterium tabacisoli]
MQTNKSNTTRFSDRVSDYVKYRPHYPKEMIEKLSQTIGLESNFIVADIGSGTGLSSQRFIEAGNLVYAVEPNLEMRQASEAFFDGNKNFKPINGTAEETTLEDQSIDLIFCGQAYHWFDFEKAKKEFLRILKPEGTMVLAWNERSIQDPFQQKYERLMRKLIPEYAKVTQKNINVDEIRSFLAPKVMELIELDNQQIFNLTELKGRLRSSSYAPKEGDKNYDVVMNALEQLFDSYQENGKVIFKYDTMLYVGR